MQKTFFIYLFLSLTHLYACATCQLMIPTAEIELDLQIDNKKLNNIHTKWKFSDIYSQEILSQYDKNKNEKLDKDELAVILKAKLDYLLPKKMLTEIQYSNYEDTDSTDIVANYKNFDLKMLDECLIFSYDSYVDLEITDKLILSFLYKDDESYFSFITSSIDVNSSGLYYEKNLYLFTASIFFSYSPPEIKDEPKSIVEQNQTQVQESKKPKNIEDDNIQESLLKKSITEIKSLFESIKDEKNPLSYAMLLIFAYIYGVVHALGPGHGKTLVGSYFLSNERSYSKALFISLAIGVVHTFSAFIFTLLIYFVVDTFLAQFLEESVFYTTKISALIIIGIALYLIYKKITAYKITINTPNYSFSTNPHVSSCSCYSCKVDKNSTDAALIISAGIVPCPGTITIFIFSFSLSLYFAGFLSALVMSLGMSSIIFLSALLSVTVRKKTSIVNLKLKKYLEFASLIIILILGLFLLLI